MGDAMPLPPDYLERVYAGVIGKNVGIRLGAPVEPAIWTYQRIREIYGEVRAYLKPYRTFAADDDANGPFYFIRPLVEGDPTVPLEPVHVARAWLDFARDGKGMFWWGGYGNSTEHTAYLNLKAGISAPESGSIARNGAVVAEQIGGQIFIDSWGLVWPGRPEQAARYAATAASVSHDGDGLNGARFIAACIAAAFDRPAGAIREVVEAGLAQVPAGSTYAKVARAVMQFHDTHPGDWRPCQEFLIAEWGYDKWPGLCHVIPNAGVCVLALLYGGGDFCRTIEIATMCGWDTDCNAGNVGSILGVLCGLDAIPAHYRDPINDALVLSGLPGSLNILDLPTWSRILASLGHTLAGATVPRPLADALSSGDGERALSFDFALPGSTHGMRVSDPVAFAAVHRDVPGPGGKTVGALEFRYERVLREATGRLFYKPFYRRADFDDERYSPTFAPTARPGQSVRIRFRRESWEGEKIGVAGYVRETWSGRVIPTTAALFPEPDREQVIAFAIPQVDGSQVDEVGLTVTGWTGAGRRDSGRLLVDLFEISGKARYTIDPARQAVEFGCVTPFSHNRGTWSLQDGRMHLMTHEACASYTGGHAVGDQRVTAVVRPLAGDSHLLVARAGGAMRGYAAGFDGPGRVSLFCHDFGVTRLATAKCAWQAGRDYRLSLEAVGAMLRLSVDGAVVLETHDARHAAGMVGCGSGGPARTLYGLFEVEEL
jgi:ADP-ribosylglycohydrolase